MKTVEEVVAFCRRMQDDAWAKAFRHNVQHPGYTYWAARAETLGFIIEQIEAKEDEAEVPA